MNIWIDADACPAPVKTIVFRASQRVGVPVILVANHRAQTPPSSLITAVQVGQGLDAADDHIARHSSAGDLVVTADIPLAARCIDAGARVVKHDGSVLNAANIGQVLAMRDLAADLRAADPFRQGSGKPFAPRDRSRFAQTLERLLGHPA